MRKHQYAVEHQSRQTDEHNVHPKMGQKDDRELPRANGDNEDRNRRIRPEAQNHMDPGKAGLANMGF